ncbi:MAG: secretin N-terminal domain-containing protein [Gammaproteobacteria bacterium]|nr:secretin N-terminal domain-containing protein [Gammaproteobacteria bacterium]MDH3534651.1 secretin N-terminal domain-containing protein [Gammaproteobacteria bacterium]
MKNILLLLALLSLTACKGLMGKDERMAVSDAHVGAPVPVAEQAEIGIPPVVEQVPIIAAPEPEEPMQTFTVVATDLPASELLFALARDARLNLDIDPSIDARVSINAIDQTLPQILKRISRQVALRYYLDGPNLVVEVDKPFTRVYRIDYLNMSRETQSSIDVATQIASTGTVAGGSGGGGGSNSSTTVTNEAVNNFWKTLEENIGLLANIDGAAGTVISNRESGTISVRTTSAAHRDIQRFVDAVMGSARRQVLIEATVVEVTLNDEFQAGVDWSRIAVGDGWSLQQNLLGQTLGATPFTSATYANSNTDRDISAAIKALDTFGDVSVMSSPKIMALNNQTSVLKVVDNLVYFTTDVDETEGTSNNAPKTTIDTTINTVPVGFVMNVTPYITDTDEVILNIRPTISRVLEFVPTPTIPTALGLIPPNEVPVIQVREMESVLRVTSGNTAVLGGLMQDTADVNDAGIPGLHDVKGVGLLFGTKGRQYNKTELVIFLRPRVIDNASLDTSLQDFKKFLKPEVFSEQ